MEYLPWVLIALGLFLLFVVNHRRLSGVSVVNVSPDLVGSDVRVKGGRTFQVNTPVLKEAPVVPATPTTHGSAVWMPIILSLMVTGSALMVILLPGYYGEAQQKWAFGVIGLILGYWFKR